MKTLSLNSGLCRTCLKRNGSVQSIFGESSDLSISLAEIINTSIPSVHIIKNDGYSDKICTNCAQKILDFYQLKLDIEKNQVILKMGIDNEVGIFMVQHLEENKCNGLMIKEENLEDNIEKEADFSSLKLKYLHHEMIIKEDELKQEVMIPSVDDSYTEENTIDDKKEVGLSSLNQKQENTEGSSEDDLSMEETTTNYDIQHEEIYLEEIKYESSQSDETSSNQNQLEKHTNNKLFKCKTCHNTFKRKSNLKTHLSVHSMKKALKCEICHKLFSHRGNLKNHLPVHSKKKPFECEICHKIFELNHSLKRHILIHSDKKPFKCKHCEKTFRDKNHLYRHLLVHSGGKPFECEICDKPFGVKTNLRRHLLTHFGIKRFKCKYCDKTFTQNSSLKTHLLIKHPDKKDLDAASAIKLLDTNVLWTNTPGASDIFL